MSKNQKPAVKQQPKTKAVNPALKNTCTSDNCKDNACKDENCKCSNDTCKCNANNGTFKIIAEYDEIAEENTMLKDVIANMTKEIKRENKKVNDLEVDLNRKLCREITENEYELTEEVKKLKSALKKKDEIVLSLQGNVDYYRTRSIWTIIKERWFGC